MNFPGELCNSDIQISFNDTKINAAGEVEVDPHTDTVRLYASATGDVCGLGSRYQVILSEPGKEIWEGKRFARGEAGSLEEAADLACRRAYGFLLGIDAMDALKDNLSLQC